MGYRTSYNLSTELEDYSSPEKSQQHEKIIGELLAQYPDSAAWAIDQYGSCKMETTWHNCDEELCEFSKQYPDILFELSGTGDGVDDLWTTYYKNGLMQETFVQLHYPPFDPQLLHEPGVEQKKEIEQQQQLNDAIKHAVQFFQSDIHFSSPGSVNEAMEIAAKLTKYGNM